MTRPEETGIAAAVAEGTAFNAPNSERVLTCDVPEDGGLASGLVDESDLQEQLSRMNSDFEDGLDVSRAGERRVSDDEIGPPTFATLLAQGLRRAGTQTVSRLRSNPSASAIGLIGLGAGLGFLLASRVRGRRLQE